MKIMSRNFSTSEKILLAVLALVLVALAYYYFVDQPIRANVGDALAEAENLQTELDVIQARVVHLQSVQSSMDALTAEGNLTWMSSYNNSKAELSFLNDILADTLKYSITFADVTRSGNQIRRSFTLQYTARNYTEAQDIMTRLLECENRCLVSEAKCSIAPDGKVTMTQSATFYETMVGGTPDAGLPKDSAQVNS
ncbi:MAG: type II secretion system protein M [Clostridia bacterium]|nr:type II secretion system protein M [Clostridia bacterium]MBQ8962795.1 type II secretion system protein M [Clostridia bacterium]